MKNIKDFKNKRIGELTGALGHHTYFTENAEVRGNIIKMSRYVKKNGVAEFIKNEYPFPENKNKNIIINSIDGQLFVTDGNKHCVAMIIANVDITVGDLLALNNELFRYWETGYEKGADTTYQPYVTYIPLNINVSRLPESRQGTDDKNQRINIIPSNIPYNSSLFDEKDRGRQLYQTAHMVEIENIYAENISRVKNANDFPEVLGYCGVMYDEISKVNVKYGFVKPNAGYDHTSIYYIAERVKKTEIQDRKIRDRVNSSSTETVASDIFANIDAYVRNKK